MRRFWRELREFWQQVRADYPRQKMDEDFYIRTRPLLSLELRPEYSLADCFKYAWSCTPRYEDKVATLARIFYTRLGRGNVSLETCKRIYESGGQS